VAFFFVVALSAALASDVVLDIDLDKQDQIQIGEPGRAVAGSYSFIDSDDKDHTVKYIADEKGYRVVDGTPTYIKPVPAVVQPYQYIQYIRHHPSSYPVQYVPAGALPSPGFKYVYNGSKYVLQPLAGESSRRGSVHSFHPNVVYALVK